MKMTLAAAAEAIFTVMDVLMTHPRQCTAALIKWRSLVVSYSLVMLGLVFNTRNMTVQSHLSTDVMYCTFWIFIG